MPSRLFAAADYRKSVGNYASYDAVQMYGSGSYVLSKTKAA